MGAWGPGIFDDDTAYDFEAELRADPLAFFRAAFAHAHATPALEYDRAHAVTVAAAYLDNLLHGSTFRTDHAEATDVRNVNRFQALHPELVAAGRGLAPDAARALAVVLADGCELQQLWRDNARLYPQWRAGLEAVMHRLGATAAGA